MTLAPWRSDGLNRIRLFYLLTQGAFGIYLPFINVYFEQQLHLSGQEIGILAAVAPLMTLVMAPIWGSAADARGSRLAILRLVLLGTGAGVLLLWLPATFYSMLLVMALFMLFQVAIIPLSDGLIAAAASKRNVAYGSLRLWGSIGFALGGLFFGQISRWFGLGSLFACYAMLIALAIPLAWRMVPDEPPPPEQVSSRGLLRDRPLVLFLIVACLASIGITAGYLFLFIFLGLMGADSGLMGAVSAIGALAEIPMMFLSGRLITRHGARPVFVTGMALFVLGWTLHGSLQTANWAPAIQALNGAAMGLLWPAAVTYAAQRAPAGRNASAQSLLSAVMYGIGPLMATPLAGAIFDAAGARTVLRVAAAVLATGIVLALVARSKEAKAA